MLEVSRNPHFPVIGQNWDEPLKQTPRQLFETPMKLGEIEGSSPKPFYARPAIPSHDKRVPQQSRKIFEAPRDILRLIPQRQKPLNLSHSREPTPASRKVFKDGQREETKYFCPPVNQINLDKSPRRIVGIQSPIEDHRTKLFEKPRETMKYGEIEGCHPRPTFDPESLPQDATVFVLPNRKKLFGKPREIEELDGEHTRPQIPTDRSPRDIFPLVEEQKKQLFKAPRELMMVVDHPKQISARAIEDTMWVIDNNKPKIFAKPRDFDKYADVKGSKPAARGQRTRISPTFQSSIFDF